jgi:hypothetical protein
MRRYLDWIFTKAASKLVAQIKVEIILLVPEIADGFRATIAPVLSLNQNEGVSFHTFLLLEDHTSYCRWREAEMFRKCLLPPISLGHE